MIKYTVLKAIEGHVYPGAVGSYQTEHLALGERISELLQRDGHLVQRQDQPSDSEREA